VAVVLLLPLLLASVDLPKKFATAENPLASKLEEAVVVVVVMAMVMDV
jgi:hypothetical protein